MNKAFLVLVAAVVSFAGEITTQEQLVKAINTPSGLNRCMGARLEPGHDGEFIACVRRYFPSCWNPNYRHNGEFFKCMSKTEPVNVSASDRERKRQIDAYIQKRNQTKR